ncbi:metallophosphoesterase [Marinobacterium arenosum]|uniref:metallophosphoesterase n=1 Tax=Marinobacterium arenosum TaxID=2862496 RepID=UPI001C98132B|nr:metallophosphoesterase [Marinobacterium arenosum]MBY4676161.1 metallophosphoesterase [Marinobacterium arenosum]
MASSLIIQLTDLHLPRVPTDPFRGVDVAGRLQRMLDHLAERFERIDQLLLTGDLTDHGDLSTYRWLQTKVQGRAGRISWIPGNHDCAELMDGELRPRRIELPGWRLVLLDTTAEPDGRGGGSLADSELQALDAELAGSDRPLMLVLHHNPLATGSGWQDPIMLGNADAFWRIVERYPQVKLAIHGHIHHAFEQRRGQVRVLGTPAIAPQFKPRQADFCEEDDPALTGPAARWLRLHDDGRFETGLIRLSVGS